MTLNAPTKLVFLISLLIAVIALVGAFGFLAMIPISAVWIMTVAYALLALACVLRGI